MAAYSNTAQHLVMLAVHCVCDSQVKMSAVNQLCLPDRGLNYINLYAEPLCSFITTGELQKQCNMETLAQVCSLFQFPNDEHFIRSRAESKLFPSNNTLMRCSIVTIMICL